MPDCQGGCYGGNSMRTHMFAFAMTHTDDEHQPADKDLLSMHQS